MFLFCFTLNKRTLTQMKIYHGKILNSITLLVLKLVLIGVALWITNPDSFLIPNFSTIIILLAALSILILIYAISVNNDIIIGEDKIIIRKRLIFYEKKKSINIADVQGILLKHDWTETVASKLKQPLLRYFFVELILQTLFPPDYKWIKIKTNSETVKYFCFGLEYDYYDNPRPHFDDLYFDLARRGINVEWTNDSDPYYQDLRRRKEKLLKEARAK